MSNKRYSKEITDKEILDTILNVTEDDISTTYVMELFGDFNGKNKVNTYDIITVPPNTYGPEGKKNKNSFKTTAGIYIFNKFFFEKELHDIIGYVNKTFNKGLYEDINKKLSYALLEDEITVEQLKHYSDKSQKFMPYVSIVSSNITEEMLMSSNLVKKKKEELAKKYEKEISEGRGDVIEQIEKELLAYAKDELKDDPSCDSFNSGARGSWGNHYKNMFICKGATVPSDPTKQGFNIIMDNYMDGVSRENYSALADALVVGPYSRGVRTQIGGYWEKLFINAFQHITLDKAGSDCGTDKYIEVTLNNPDLYMYSYIIEGNNLVELTSKNVDKYKGKRVKLRFSSLCKSKTGICNKCAGNFYYRLGLTNVGAASPVIPSTLKLRVMKSFHDTTQKFTEIDPMKAFSLE